MQVPKTSRSIGVKCAALVTALGLAVCGALPATAETSQENDTGNMVFFKGGFMGLRLVSDMCVPEERFS